MGLTDYLTTTTAKAVYAALFTGALHAAGHYAFGDPAVFEQAGVTYAGVAAMIGGGISYYWGSN